MKYTIITSTDPEELAKEINDYLSRGGTLIGGVSVSQSDREPTVSQHSDYECDNFSITYAQAMMLPRHAKRQAQHKTTRTNRCRRPSGLP